MNAIERALETILDSPLNPRKGDELKARLQTLRRILARSPEVVVKITKRRKEPLRTAAALNKLADYLMKHGKEAENERGETLAAKEEFRAESALWLAEHAAQGKLRFNRGEIAKHLIFSMPRDTVAPQPLLQAVRAFAADEFKNHAYLMVLHTHQNHPHVHMVVKLTGFDGKRLSHSKERGDLERWRSKFAEQLRARGIEAEATPKAARGVVKRPQSHAMHHLSQDPKRSTVIKQRMLEAAREALSRQQIHRPWEDKIKDRRTRLVDAYETIAQACDAMKTPEGRALAEHAREFVRQMPPPETQREADVRRAREVARQRGR